MNTLYVVASTDLITVASHHAVPDCSEFDMLRQDQERMKENRKLPDSDSQ